MAVSDRWKAALVAVALVALAAAPAHAEEADTDVVSITVPFAGISEELSQTQRELDAATAQALDLEHQISGLEAESAALGERLEVTADRIRAQRLQVDLAEARLAEAQERYDARLVEVYKRGAFNPLALLLSSETIADLLSRATVLSHIAEDDSRVVADLNVAAADARYQESTLEDLMSQDKILQQEQESRMKALEKALRDQEALVASLTEEARAALMEARRLDAKTRQQWRDASIPIGTKIPRAEATVRPYTDRVYLISAYMPRTYETTGKTWTSVTSWYGPGFNGRGTASGQVFNQADFTCASRTLPFGTVLALTRGSKRVIVYVNDRGPYVAGRDLDLSAASARALDFWGVTSVHAEIITPVYE